MDNQTNQQDHPEKEPARHGTSITGQDKEPLRSDDTTAEYEAKDNLHTEEQENSANGLDSTEIRGGQNGRNIRAMGSQDMDSANGVLRFNDLDDTTMQVTEEAKTSMAASDAQTGTGTGSVTTTNPLPADADVPNAQQAAEADTDIDDTDQADDETGESDEGDVAKTGTDLNFKPAA